MKCILTLCFLCVLTHDVLALKNLVGDGSSDVIESRNIVASVNNVVGLEGQKTLPLLPNILWDASSTFSESKINTKQYPSAFFLFGLKWNKLSSDVFGKTQLPLIEPMTEDNQFLFVRSGIYMTKTSEVKFKINYSGKFHVFHNLQYQNISKHGLVTLTLEKGWNEIFFELELMHDNAQFLVSTNQVFPRLPYIEQPLNIAWQVGGFNVPESVIYDKSRDVFYISNFAQSDIPLSGFVSRVSGEGKMLDLTWATELSNPTGMLLHKSLYVVERHAVAVINPQTGRIEKRYPLPPGTFYNDITADDNGIIFLSDTSTEPCDQDILRLVNGSFEPVSSGSILHRVNGLYWHQGHLIAGSTGNGHLVAIDPNTGIAETLTTISGGILDGIRSGQSNTLLVSLWRGPIFEVDWQGQIRQILASPGSGHNAADFEYLQHRRLLVIPTFLGNKLMAYTYPEL